MFEADDWCTTELPDGSSCGHMHEDHIGDEHDGECVLADVPDTCPCPGFTARPARVRPSYLIEMVPGSPSIRRS